LDPALTSAGTGIRKPNPEAFAPILAAWDLPPASVVMVGDTLDADILAAHHAGMRSVWLRSQQDARQETVGIERPTAKTVVVPDATVDHLRGVPACLEKLEG
jgi:FMN phosphatase YigB (HAD superfamily)